MEAGSLEIGRIFLISFPENVPSDETLYFIQDKKICGIILFADHCRDQDNLKSWLKEIKASLPYQLIVAIDQEGGRVRRLKDRFPTLEAPRYYGERERYKAYRDDLSRVCERLREIGINLNLVPTIDLFDSAPNHVLDTRTFSADIDIVSGFARITIDVHREQGLLTCGKHFPGLGRSSGDPHHVLAEADLSDTDFFEKELKPFEDIIDYGVDSIMVTHLLLPQVDNNICTISEKVVKGWLRGRLGFKKAVISDDLLMDGAQKAVPLPQLAEKSLLAGMDILLFGQNIKKARETREYLTERLEENQALFTRAAEAIGRIGLFSDRIIS